jgi:predicted nucleic acid-binding protein
MSVFVDTNIFLRSAQPSHPLHGVAVSAVASLIALGTPLTVTPQIMAEFWNVATRPVERNGLGFSHTQAQEELFRLEAFVVRSSSDSRRSLYCSAKPRKSMPSGSSLSSPTASPA